MEPQINFTEAAAEKVRAIIVEEGNMALKLRVFVKGGGCSGFQYGFELEEHAQEDDLQFETNGIGMVIDAMSMQYLAGSSVDYVETLAGSNFTIKNPNTTSKCGCGSSFAV